MMFNGRRRIGLGSIINRLGFEGCFFFFGVGIWLAGIGGENLSYLANDWQRVFSR
jgi:hypothetical protein